MISRFRQILRHRLSSDALLGDTLLVRLRSVTVGLLGLVTAVGLGLVVLLMQQGWPSVLGGPLPPAPPRFVHNEAISQPPAGDRGPARAPARALVDSRRARPSAPRRLVVDSAAVGVAPRSPSPPGPESHGPTPKPGGSHPSPQPQAPAPQPTAAPAPPAAAPEPEPAQEPAPESSPEPVAAAAPDDDSDDSPGYGWHPSGPPSWSGHGGYGGHSHGGPDWSGGHGGWGH